MYKTVVVPLDGSELGKCGLDEVANVAEPDARIILMRVMEGGEDMMMHPLVGAGTDWEGQGFSDNKTDLVFGAGTQIQGRAVEEFAAKNTEDANAWLRERADTLKKRGFSNVETRLVSGKPADGIVALAEKNQADLIVISTHGRSGVSRWAYGSVADKVLRAARMPVLLVTPSGCRLEPV